MGEVWLDAASRAQVQTPAIVVDLDRVEANIARMAGAMRDRSAALRPHVKTHKSLEFGVAGWSTDGRWMPGDATPDQACRRRHGTSRSRS